MSDYGMFPVDAEAAEVRLCGGFRMTAHRDDSACTGAVVRKPSSEGTRGRWGADCDACAMAIWSRGWGCVEVGGARRWGSCAHRFGQSAL